jgi:proline iminopeptidase
MSAPVFSEVSPYVVHHGLAIYCIGSGEPVLLMPGPHRFQIPGDGSARLLIEGLQALGHQVISFDPPESGHSARPAQLSMAEMHDCTNEALSVLGLCAPIDAFGHSMGGLTLLAYALDHPSRVRRLVLVGTGSGGRAYMKTVGSLANYRHPQFFPMVLRAALHTLLQRRATEALLNNFISRCSFYHKPLADLDSISLRDWLRPSQGHTDWHRIARRLDYAPRLAELAAPTLLLCGRHDPQFPPAASQELADGIQNAHLIWFEKSGHFPFIEESESFWRAIANFLDSPHQS